MSEVRGPGGEWRPIVTVDVVLMTIVDGTLCAGVLTRLTEPFMGSLALPGGYVRPEEDASIEAAALRVLRGKAGLPPLHIEQLQVFSGPDRDPRGWSVSTAFLALIPAADLPAEDGMLEMRPVAELQVDGILAFDHREILKAALSRLRGKGDYSTLPAALVGQEFTILELRNAYEIAFGTEINKSDFRRKLFNLGVLEDTGRFRKLEGGPRPAAIYRLADGMATYGRSFNWSGGQ